MKSLVRFLQVALLVAGILPGSGCSSSSSGGVVPDPTSEVRIDKQGVLDLGADDLANPGDLIAYTLDVANTGDVVLTGVSVNDPDLSDVDCGGGTDVIGTMTPGATAQCTGTYAITQTDIDAGQKVNTADVEGTDPDGGPVTDDDTHTVVVPRPAPEIRIDKQGALDLGADDLANPGDLIAYTLDVANTGDVVLTGVSVNDPDLPDVDCGGGTDVIGTMTPDATAQCTGTYAITQADIDAGQKVNTADVEGTDPDGGPVTDDDTHIVVVPDPDQAISGEYAIEVEVASDSCGFGTTPGSLVMFVDIRDDTFAIVDIPIGGAGGECAPANYVRADNTLTRFRTGDSQSGTCLVRTDVTTAFTFFADDSVTGTEIDILSAAGGDCSSLDLPCEIELAATGTRCSGCYDCTPGSPIESGQAGNRSRVVGPLGASVYSLPE